MFKLKIINFMIKFMKAMDRDLNEENNQNDIKQELP